MIERFPSKMNSLSHIKKFLNDEVNCIIDVGILISTIELMRIFPHKKHVLVEPLSEYFDKIRENYSKANIDYDLLPIAASNRQGRQVLKKINHLPHVGAKYGNVTASNLIFSERDVLSNDEILVETQTIDNIKKNYPGPYLIKIDVDGAEFQILEGLTDCSDVYIVVVESWLSRIQQFVDVLASKGFVLYDITDLCYMRGQLSQIDCVFINKKLLNNPSYKEISPRNFGFSSAQRGNYVPFKEDQHLLDSDRVDRLMQIVASGDLPTP